MDGVYWWIKIKLMFNEEYLIWNQHATDWQRQNIDKLFIKTKQMKAQQNKTK